MSNLATPRDTRAIDQSGANVARRLTATAARMSESLAIVVPRGRGADGKRIYDTCTFAQLEAETNRLASGLRAYGVTPGTRLALMVRPGREFIALVFALFKAGAVVVLIDPGMGLRNMIDCLAEVQPEGFVAIPTVQAVRALLARRFRQGAVQRHGWAPLGLGRLDVRRAAPPRRPAADLPPRRTRRFGGHHFHVRQHGPAQGRALLAWQLRSAGDRARRVLRHRDRAKSTCPVSRCSGCSIARWA